MDYSFHEGTTVSVNSNRECYNRKHHFTETALPKVECVRDKSNLKIGHENYPKTVRFFDRDLSTGHVTSFSM